MMHIKIMMAYRLNKEVLQSTCADLTDRIAVQKNAVFSLDTQRKGQIVVSLLHAKFLSYT